MKTEDEIKAMIKTQNELLAECKGKGCGYQKQLHLRAIEMLAWVLG